jgi:hypothetical protein
VERRGDRLGALVADDDVPVAFVAAGRRGTGSRQTDVDDTSDRRFAHIVEPVSGDDRAALALGAKVGGADGVAARRWVELVRDGESRPRRVHVDIVGEGHQGHELGARGTGADLGDRHRPVGAVEPFRVGETGAHPERGDGTVGGRHQVGVFRTVDLAWQQHTPLDPRMLQDVERARQVAADRVPDQSLVHDDAVERVLVAAHELLEHHRDLRVRRVRCEPAFELARVVDPERVARPGAGEWLDDEREPDVADDRADLIGGVGPSAPRARDSRPFEDLLHPGLVAEVLGDDRR